MTEAYEVHALKCAERGGRTRGDSFLFDDDAEGARRGRPVLRDAAACRADFGVDAGSVETVIATHLHHDHAGALERVPNAVFHVQAAEMAFATGPCMCDEALRHPFTAEHVCALVRKVYSGRVVFHAGPARDPAELVEAAP